MRNYIKAQVLLRKRNNVYDLRRAICSRTIEEGITSKIKKLEYIQGHTIGVMLEFYNVYSKKQEKNKEIIIGI